MASFLKIDCVKEINEFIYFWEIRFEITACYPMELAIKFAEHEGNGVTHYRDKFGRALGLDDMIIKPRTAAPFLALGFAGEAFNLEGKNIRMGIEGIVKGC